MEWSGNFSQEEYLALAQELSEEDTPGIVTLESFKGAAMHGLVSFSRERGTCSTTGGRDAPREDNHGCHVSATPVERSVGQGHGRTRDRRTWGAGRQSRQEGGVGDPHSHTEVV